MLIKGRDLTPRQREQVLAAFIYRWTSDNRRRESVYQNIPKPTIPLQTDDEWLVDHAFHFIKDGSRLSMNCNFAEPHYMADED